MEIRLYEKDELVEYIRVENNEILENIAYTDRFMGALYRNVKTYPVLFRIMKKRVMCKERWTPELLDSIGLKEYNVIEILKRTHGLDRDDFHWLTIDDDSVRYEDIKIRD